MTKPRDPLCFSLAITTITDFMGYKEAARATRRAVRTVRHWSESDKAGTASLDKAIALDKAFLAAGGGYAPILESYARQLEVAIAEAAASRMAFADEIALASRETGEALSHCIQALQPGRSPAELNRALAEIEQAAAVYPRLISWVKNLLRGNGAAREAKGEI